MNDVTRDDFVTDGQYRKHLKLKVFFEQLITLYKNGCFFMVDEEIWKKPFINGTDMGIDNLYFTGMTTDPEEDKVWIDVSVTELKKRITVLKRIKL